MANFVLLKQVFRRMRRTLLFSAGLKDEQKYEIQKKWTNWLPSIAAAQPHRNSSPIPEGKQ